MVAQNMAAARSLRWELGELALFQIRCIVSVSMIRHDSSCSGERARVHGVAGQGEGGSEGLGRFEHARDHAPHHRINRPKWSVSQRPINLGCLGANLGALACNVKQGSCSHSSEDSPTEGPQRPTKGPQKAHVGLVGLLWALQHGPLWALTKRPTGKEGKKKQGGAGVPPPPPRDLSQKNMSTFKFGSWNVD